MNESKLPYLVDTSWLAAHLHDADLRLVEVLNLLDDDDEAGALARSWGQRHIPGAVPLNVGHHGALRDPAGKFPATWPTPAQFSALMGRLGIGNDCRVVIYARSPVDGPYTSAIFTARAWWIMHAFGVRCAILDASFETWSAEGRPTSAEPARHAPATFQVRPGWERYLAHKEDVLAALAEPRHNAVVNALPADQYQGSSTRHRGPRKGHISGSRSVPLAALFNRASGRFAPREALREAFAAAGALDAQHVITYCGSGYCAAGDAFALALLGHEDVAVYDNSLAEWSADPALPMTDPSAGPRDP